MAENTKSAVLRRAIEICIRPDEPALAGLSTVFTEDASVWSPNLLAVGIADIAASLEQREDTFSDVEIEFDTLTTTGALGIAEFRVLATFSGPFALDDEVVVPPNGQRLLLGAAAIADFDGDRIKAIRAYFDDATLLEQMLAS